MDIDTILAVAIVLSVVVLLLVVVAVIDVWRRTSFPEIAYGGIALTQRRLRWVWFVALLGAVGLSAAEDPFVTQTADHQYGELQADAGTVRRVTKTIPLPFYRFEQERTYVNDELASEHLARGLQIPGTLLTTLLAYLLLVVRWNPENRWALRILHGRRHGRDHAPGEEPSAETRA